jgi:hypothetical protein
MPSSLKSSALVVVVYVALTIQSISCFSPSSHPMRTTLSTPTTPTTTTPTTTSTSRNMIFGKKDNNAEELRKQAQKLRQEVNQFEQTKKDENQKVIKQNKKIQQQKQDEYMQYSAEVPILKGDGTEVMERVQFLPRFKAEEEGSSSNKKKNRMISEIITIQAPLPLGLILGQSDELPGLTTVDEIGEGSNGEQAGVQVGDLVRACTACQVSMEMPTWQLMAGGIGRPKTSRMMFSTDGKPFEEVMDALVSNQMDPNGRDVWLVIERMK